MPARSADSDLLGTFSGTTGDRRQRADADVDIVVLDTWQDAEWSEQVVELGVHADLGLTEDRITVQVPASDFEAIVERIEAKLAG